MKIKLVVLFVAIYLSSNGQTWVTIPDSHFAILLQNLIPGAMNGNQMDITNPLVTTTTKRIGANYNSHVSNFSGIEYFTSLQWFNCNGCWITSLPNLPNSLDTLMCHDNTFTSWPTFPNSLTYLDCGGNTSLYSNISAFPPNLTYLNCATTQQTSLAPLPASLVYLDCGNSSLTSLPTLPNSLTYLNCGSNNLANLPLLPNSLTHLICSYQLNNVNYTYSLFSLPTLPNSLTYLDCNTNGLTGLPTLPNSLTTLYCYSNSLTSLPALPNSLANINCTFNSLTSLPSLPQSLIALYCNSNSLTSLPVLPNSLTHLDCSNNKINCFPIFPNSIYNLVIDPNPYNCLPNYIPAILGADTIKYPLCSSANINGCNPAAPDCGANYTYTLVAGNLGQVDFSIISAGYSNIWHFGDNHSDTSQVGLTAQHFYPNGTYTVQCVTKDSTNQIICLSTQTITITNSITDIKNNVIRDNIELTIYPNPAQNNFTIQTNISDKQTLQVFDVNGKLVLTQAINGKTNIDASNLAEGVYNLSLQNSSGIINKRLVIVR